jgi:hypothetical protein
MSLTDFKPVAVALSESPDWAPIDRAWRESEGLTDALRHHVPASLFTQVLQVRRGDPVRGVRGSLVTVIAKTASAAAKLRLALSDWDQALRAAGWGVQQVKVVEQRQQSLTDSPPPVKKRDPIPTAAAAALQSVANDVPNEALRRALSRLARHTADRGQ